MSLGFCRLKLIGVNKFRHSKVVIVSGHLSWRCTRANFTKHIGNLLFLTQHSKKCHKILYICSIIFHTLFYFSPTITRNILLFFTIGHQQSLVIFYSSQLFPNKIIPQFSCDLSGFQLRMPWILRPGWCGCSAGPGHAVGRTSGVPGITRANGPGPGRPWVNLCCFLKRGWGRMRLLTVFNSFFNNIWVFKQFLTVFWQHLGF